MTTRSAPVRATSGLEFDVAGFAHRAGVERGDLAHAARRSCTRSGRCGGAQTRIPNRSRRRGAPARTGTRRSRPRPHRRAPGDPPSCAMPKAMLAATPPRRTTRSSTRNDSDTLSQVFGEQLLGEASRESASGDQSRSNRTRDGMGDLPIRRHDTANRLRRLNHRVRSGECGLVSRRRSCRTRSHRRRWGCRS